MNTNHRQNDKNHSDNKKNEFQNVGFSLFLNQMKILYSHWPKFCPIKAL